MMKTMVYQNDLFLRAANGETVERPPVWLMRQAGRILPQYRAVRESLRDFKELVETPERAAEVTIQPVDELNVDAAIIFSDILVIPEALGLPYEMVEKSGPYFPKVIQRESDILKLRDGMDAAAELGYVYDAISLTVKELNGKVPLIGFAGAPFTILAYMVEGHGSKTFSKAKKLLYGDAGIAHTLLQKITDATIVYLKYQVRAGASLIQIFDSWAGILSPEQYRRFSLPYINQICAAIQEVPKTVFAKGAWFALQDFKETQCQVVGLDWNTDPVWARAALGEQKVLQGNLDPCALYAPSKTIEDMTLKMLRQFNSQHIANLGHGVYPDTPLENVKTFVNTIKKFNYTSF